MKTLTISQFEKLVFENAQNLKTTYEEVEVDYSEKFEAETARGWIYNTLTLPGMTITYQNKYEHIVDKIYSLHLYDDQPEIFIIQDREFEVLSDPNVDIVGGYTFDEGGKKLSAHEIGDIVAKITPIRRFDLTVFKIYK